MTRHAALLAILLALAACTNDRENDPVYQQLKANPPTEIPARHLPKLRTRLASCDVYNEGDRFNQYMTCWWPGGAPSGAYLTYYGANPLYPPTPSMISVPGGRNITEYLPLNEGRRI